MQSHQVTGIILILGALAMIFGIAAHHGPHGGLTEGRHLVVAAIVVGSFIITGVGLLRLLRSNPSHLSNDIAIVVLALAGACGSLAAISGHVAIPRFIEYKNASQEQDQAIVDAIITHDSIRNATLTQTMFAAWAIAVLCLSVAMLKNSLVWKTFGACGTALGLFLLVALAFGRLQINMHDVGLTVLASAIWLIAIGSALCVNKTVADQ